MILSCTKNLIYAYEVVVLICKFENFMANSSKAKDKTVQDQIWL